MNAMHVDSTALPEQAVRDILASAFQSRPSVAGAALPVRAGGWPRPFRTCCSARWTSLPLGDPWNLATDIGPVIDRMAQEAIRAYIEAARAEGRVLKELSAPQGTFIAPNVIRVTGNRADVARDLRLFGPVLHVATFPRDRDRRG